MMHFTPQQVQGGGKYHHKTRMGNWQEDWALEESKYTPSPSNLCP